MKNTFCILLLNFAVLSCMDQAPSADKVVIPQIVDKYYLHLSGEPGVCYSFSDSDKDLNSPQGSGYRKGSCPSSSLNGKPIIAECPPQQINSVGGKLVVVYYDEGQNKILVSDRDTLQSACSSEGSNIFTLN